MVFFYIGVIKVDNKVFFGVYVNICINELWNFQKLWFQGFIFFGFYGNFLVLIEYFQ